MASYSIEWKQSAASELRKLDRQIVGRIVDAVRGLQEDPFPSGCRKLVGTERAYRIRVGDYRIIYAVQTGRLVVLVIRVGHRREVYR